MQKAFFRKIEPVLLNTPQVFRVCLFYKYLFFKILIIYSLINFNTHCTYSQNNCNTALPLIISPSDALTFGPFSNVTSEPFGLLFTDCFGDDPIGQPAWFTFVGDGNVYEIATIACSASTPDTLHNTQLFVATSTDCFIFNFAACNENRSPNDSLSSVTLPTLMGEQYYILIDGVGTQMGNFCLSVNPSCGFSKSQNGTFVKDGGNSQEVVLGDYDNDGDLDAFVANFENSEVGQNNILYNNNFGGVFGTASGGVLNTDGGASYAAAWGDFNNDGWLDLYVGNRNAQANFLYKNTGDGNFLKITTGDIVTDTLNTEGVQWADFNNDGWLDMVTANDLGDNNSLYINQKDETFFKIINSPVVTEGGNSEKPNCVDYDGDGDVDIFINNYTEANFLYKNDGVDAATNLPIFTKITTGDVVTDIGKSEDATWGDYDNDGDLDLYVANDTEVNFFYENMGGGILQKITGINIVTDTTDTEGVMWGDYDNDGWLDLLFVNGITFGDNPPFNTLFKNNGDKTFTKIERQMVVNEPSRSRKFTWGDGDNDGDLDVFVVQSDEQDNTHYINHACTPNQIPMPPNVLEAQVLSSHAVQLSWSGASDNEQNTASLSYNLLLKNIVKPDEIYPAMADPATGWRKIVALGAQSQDTSWVIRDLPSGYYHWRVQAIDHSYAGSPFSTSSCFVVGDDLPMWEGDANNDGWADVSDLLPMGLYYNYTGTPYTFTDTLWQPQDRPNWTTSPDSLTLNLNPKFADSNGDGLIDTLDRPAIQQHYGNEHENDCLSEFPFSPIDPQNGAPLFFAYEQSDTIIPNFEYVFPVHLGVDSLEAYALSFRVTIEVATDEIVPDSISLMAPFVTYHQSWLGVHNSTFITLDTLLNNSLSVMPASWDIALTRMNQQNTVGVGNMCAIACVMAVGSIGKTETEYLIPLRFSFDNIRLITREGNFLSVHPIARTFWLAPETVMAQYHAETPDFTIFPNPIHERDAIFVAYQELTSPIVGFTIFNTAGQLIRRERHDSTQKVHRVNVANLVAGVYYMRVVDGEQVLVKRLVVVSR